MILRNVRSYLFILMLQIPLLCLCQHKTYTLLVGMKQIDDQFYLKKYKRAYDPDATKGVLYDMMKMNQVAQLNGHKTTMLNDRQATREAIIAEIEKIGKKISDDDMFIFYFSGHGDLLLDTGRDEVSGFDQVLVAYNDYLVDDEINVLLTKYFTKTRNLMIVDACHSGSSYKMAGFLDFKVLSGSNKQMRFGNELKSMKQQLQFMSYDFEAFPAVDEPYSLIYFGATPDSASAIGDINGGLLTFWLDKVMMKARADGSWAQFSYRRLATELSKKLLNYKQRLEYHEIGRKVPTYFSQVPFKTY